MSQRVVIRNHERVNYNQREFFLLNHSFYTEDGYIEKHWHNSVEISYVVKGEKVQTYTNGKKIIAKTGDVLLVNSGDLHDVYVKHPFEGIVLLIDRSFMEQFCPQCINHGFNLDLDGEAKKQIENYLLELIKNQEQNNKIRSRILVLEIIDLLVNKLLEKEIFIREKHDDETYELVISIMEFLDYNYANKISLDDIAKITNYNQAYLSSVFKKKVGITIFEYLKNVRMERALQELKQGDDLIVNIAYNTGFANIQIFNREFKKMYHMTPKQYRINSRITKKIHNDTKI